MKLGMNIKFVSVIIEISILRDHSDAIILVESLLQEDTGGLQGTENRCSNWHR